MIVLKFITVGLTLAGEFTGVPAHGSGVWEQGMMRGARAKCLKVRRHKHDYVIDKNGD